MTAAIAAWALTFAIAFITWHNLKNWMVLLFAAKSCEHLSQARHDLYPLSQNNYDLRIV
jgi:hypothetical protein